MLGECEFFRRSHHVTKMSVIDLCSRLCDVCDFFSDD